MTNSELSLTEFVPAHFSRQTLSDELGETLWREYGQKVSVEFPSIKTGGEWVINAQGWVGQIPLSPTLSLLIEPKLPLANLFALWSYAYGLGSYHWLKGLVSSQSVADFYEKLALFFAQRVLQRAKQGFHRAYLAYEEPLPFVRGRLVVAQLAGEPVHKAVPCMYEEQTADIVENQLLAWTLRVIAGTPLLTDRSLPTIRQAYRTLCQMVTVRPFAAQECVGRFYSRLTEDYQPLHALCRFFLAHTMPTQQGGEHRMLPFLVDMGRLYELFVAEWLKRNVPASYTLKTQERVHLGDKGDTHFQIDLVLYQDNSPVAVLDTKYKTADRPSTEDIAQLVAYATARRAPQAILIYPTPVPFDTVIGNIRVRSVAFQLDGDLEQAGQLFLRALSI